MAKQEGTSANGRRKSSQVKRSRARNYFYLNKLLHKKLHINRGADEITAWCYPLHKRVTYTYSDMKRRSETAFTTTEVCRMINRSKKAVDKALQEGMFEKPQHTYGLTEHQQTYQLLWHEDDIMAAHAYFQTVHKGRPRKDGLITPMKLPTARELRAMIRNQEILYVKVGENFVPTWEAPDF